MKMLASSFLKNITLALVLLTASLFTNAAHAQKHPYYLHAMSDLRGARWMIEHTPGSAQRNADEQRAVQEINKALDDIKVAAAEDGKNMNENFPIDANADRSHHLHAALDYLAKARGDIDHREDDRAANDLRDRSFRHIDEAIRAVHAALDAK